MKCPFIHQRPLIGCLVPFIGAEHWCHVSCPPWHQDQEWCETNGQVSYSFDLLVTMRLCVLPIFAFCEDPFKAKIEEFRRGDRIQWQALYFVGGCTDCGCVDVGVGIQHHPDCGWEHAGNFDSAVQAIETLEEQGYKPTTILTIAQKASWKRGGNPFDF